MSIQLSVVIPTFNRCDSLRRTLEGLARQAYPLSALEVIVISDGSTDGTQAMLEEYADAAPYLLRPILQDNAGPSAARNRGIGEARHDVIVFLDDDVVPIPEFLGRHAAHHAGGENVAVIGPMLPDPKAQAQEPVWIAWEHAKLGDTYALFQPGGAWFGTPAGPHHFYSGNASVPRAALKAVGGFDTAFTRQEDVELAARLAARAGTRFCYDFTAIGLHRPLRSWESWLRVPKSYGAFDAARVQSGGLDPGEVRRLAASRSAATRALSALCAAAPPLLPAVTALARAAAVLLHRRGRTGPALAILSALYNAAYAAAFHQEARAKNIGSGVLAEAQP